MSDPDDKGDKHKTDSLPLSDQAANDEAVEEGLVTDEGINEDRIGAHGPTLEEGDRDPAHGKAKRPN